MACADPRPRSTASGPDFPANPVPIYLGVAALAVTGVVSWPVAVAAGCGYAAFRRWEPQPHGVPHPMPAPARV